MWLYQILACTITSSAPAWNKKFELPDGSYSSSNIRDYFEDILKIWKILIILQ